MGTFIVLLITLKIIACVLHRLVEIALLTEKLATLVTPYLKRKPKTETITLEQLLS